MKKVFKIWFLFTLFIIIFQFSQLIAQENCNNVPVEDTIEVVLPAINSDITEVGFAVPPIWNEVTPVNEIINIHNGSKENKG